MPYLQRIVLVVGTRPQYIKSALLQKELSKYCKLIVVDTGQHYDYDMAERFFQELKMPEPTYSLDVGSGTHAQQTASIMLMLEPILLKETPDKVVVVGDCNTTLGGALAAVKLGIPVAHIEAGPRQYDLTIPEEINRIVADHISEYLFAPTSYCAGILSMENISLDRIFETGDIMLDNFMEFAPKIVRGRKSVFVTIHRPFNTDSPYRLKQILSALCHIEGEIVFPMHPRTRKEITDTLPFEPCSPMGYLDTLTALLQARLVITDSGGIQKEAFFAGVPCITIDKNSPWQETVCSGWNRVVQPQHIVDAAKNPPIGGVRDLSMFGDGQAYKKITRILLEGR